MDIRVDDLSSPEIHALLAEHLRHMHELSPRESNHALDIDGLRQPDITFWTVWEGEELLGCGALRELSPKQGEIKSMRTVVAHRSRGVGGAVLARIIEEARARAYDSLSLETGSMPGFDPARRLYEAFGFQYGSAYGDHREDPDSVFMTLRLAPP